MREEPARPSIAPIVLSLVTLTLFILYSALTPYQQPEIRTAIRVPAVPAFVKTFSATVKIVPTGVKNYPATYAHGALTFTNGSVIGRASQQALSLVVLRRMRRFMCQAQQLMALEQPRWPLMSLPQALICRSWLSMR